MLQRLVSSRRASGHGTQDSSSPFDSPTPWQSSQEMKWASTSCIAQPDRSWQALRGFQGAEGEPVLWNQPDRPPDIPKRVSHTSSGGYVTRVAKIWTNAYNVMHG